jgi:hypothetical protein
MKKQKKSVFWLGGEAMPNDYDGRGETRGAKVGEGGKSMVAKTWEVGWESNVGHNHPPLTRPPTLKHVVLCLHLVLIFFLLLFFKSLFMFSFIFYFFINCILIFFK